MGLFCVNVHFQTTDDKALTAALDRRGIMRYHVFSASNGWTSLYEERASQQDDEWLCELAGGLSQELQVAAVAFLVHDSDIACYWLFDDGRLLDQYNSCPDYFDADASDDETQSPSGGQPEILLRYCRAGVRQDELAAILADESVFAETVIEQLAEALGIEVPRALSDYRDISNGDGDGDGLETWDDDIDADDIDADDIDAGDGPEPKWMSVARGLTEAFESAANQAPADPQVVALVQAAASGDIAAIDRLVAEGVAIESEAPVQLVGGNQLADFGKMFAGGMPQTSMTPLLAAIVHKHLQAVERLLAAGADPNHVHPLFGTAVHAATGAGEADLLRLILARGGDPNARNAQGQTPLQVVVAGRGTQARIAQTQEMMKAMGVQIPGLVDQFSKLVRPKEHWDICEQVLKEHGTVLAEDRWGRWQPEGPLAFYNAFPIRAQFPSES